MERKNVVLEDEKEVIKEVFCQVWQLYDDFKDDYLPGNEEVIGELNRYICFFRSGLKYKWPRLRGISILNFVTLGCYRKLQLSRLPGNASLDAWPFLMYEDYLKEQEKHRCK